MKARGEIPEAAEVALVSDQSSYIRNAMRNLAWEVGLGAVLVALVVGYFLRQFLPTIAIVLVILLSLFIGGLGFYFTGNTINVMTLGGLALAVGTVVDVGIVVVENIIRHLSLGKPPHQAALEGSLEVTTPVLAGTITTLAVFIPAIFLTGMIRYLFEPLAVAAVCTIVASYFVGMTVVPAFCARFLRGKKAADAETATDPAQEKRGIYVRLLSVALASRWSVLVGVFLVSAASVFLVPHLGSELFPDVDAGSIEVRMRTVPGTRLEETEKLVARIENTIKSVIPEDEIDAIIANIGLPVGKGAGFSTVLSPNSGPDSAFLVINLRQKQRRFTTSQYVDRLRQVFARDYPQEQFLFVTGGIINAALNEGAAAPINVQVSAGSLEAARDVAELVVDKLRHVDGAVDVQIAEALDFPQLDIRVDRTRAKYLGLDQEEVAKSILTALGSSVGHAPTIWIDPATGIDFFMGVQYETNEIDSLEGIRNIPLSLHSNKGPITIPLSNIATVQRTYIPGEISHYNIARVYNVLVNVSGRDLGSVARDVEAVLATIPTEKGVTLTMRGPVTAMRAGARMLGAGLVVAAILVYLVMLAQFRSFLDPLIIMLSVPLGLVGVIVILFVTNTTLNIQSLMGTLMMIGVVVNNSILLVDFANTLSAQGHTPTEAALESARIRLRPILMTAGVLIASMLPLSLRLAPGSESMVPLARAVIGGMLVSTVLTLFVVPCVYSLVKR
ncbi:MAG: hypothetical protein KatS3mg105_1720 [Gemmatales bacterium]|nr:MAG: hypothetical protein KatS3mg105_1720 [Gemmatales bacterium]